MSETVKYCDINQFIFPRPILEAELDRISSLMQHEGWSVLMDLVTMDVQAAVKASLDTARPSAERDMNVAAVKSLSWLITLKERVEQLKDCDEPVEIDSDTVDPAEPADVMRSVMDCVLRRLGVS